MTVTRAKIRLDALSLTLNDDPARRWHAVSHVLSMGAVLAAVVSIISAMAAGLAGLPFGSVSEAAANYAFPFGAALFSSLAEAGAIWCETHAPPADLPLTAQDAETVVAHLNRYGAIGFYRDILARQGPPTYRSIRDIVSDACTDAFEARQR